MRTLRCVAFLYSAAKRPRSASSSSTRFHGTRLAGAAADGEGGSVAERARSERELRWQEEEEAPGD